MGRHSANDVLVRILVFPHSSLHLGLSSFVRPPSPLPVRPSHLSLACSSVPLFVAYPFVRVLTSFFPSVCRHIRPPVVFFVHPSHDMFVCTSCRFDRFTLPSVRPFVCPSVRPSELLLVRCIFLQIRVLVHPFIPSSSPPFVRPSIRPLILS